MEGPAKVEAESREPFEEELGRSRRSPEARRLGWAGPERTGRWRVGKGASPVGPGPEVRGGRPGAWPGAGTG